MGSSIGRHSMPARRPVAIDLFSGAGGLSLGFEQAGFDVLSAVEYDPIAAAVHSFNFPQTEVVCADAAAVQGRRVANAAARGWQRHYGAEWDGDLDVVIGGPPCQGFSLIGKRAFDDARNQLVFHFARLIGKLQPRYFVMENVPGMRSVKAGEAADATPLLDLLIEEFEAFNYTVLQPKVLNACNFGVPQDRARLILLGYRHGEAAPAYPDACTMGRTRQGLSRTVKDPAEANELCPTVWDAIGDLPDLMAHDELAHTDEVQMSDAVLNGMERKASTYARRLRGLDPDPGDLSHPREWDPTLLTSSLQTQHKKVVRKRFDETPCGSTEPTSRFFRLHPGGVSSTLRAGTHYERGSFNAPRPIHPYEPRVISVREAARLHSYPDWFRFNWTKWHGFREIGNSLPPFMGRAIGAEIRSALHVSPKAPGQLTALGDRELLYLDNTRAVKRLKADASRAPRHSQRLRRNVATPRSAAA
jgi:DNA (cytosine-5)-methyltransferase 1